MKEFYSLAIYTSFLEKNGFKFEPFTIENGIWRKGNIIIFVSVLETVTFFEISQGLERAELDIDEFIVFAN
ncbi:MAG: hypothetical protein SFY32_04440 [Bacteroidota bacterium]|nr:hypothetical protein [Bacteroidota bacterium]